MTQNRTAVMSDKSRQLQLDVL